MGARNEVLLLLYLLPSFILLTIAHIIFRRELNKKNKNYPIYYNDKGKRSYMEPPQLGIHIIFIFISTILWLLLLYLYCTQPLTITS